jgi:hypothetical protein
LFAQQEPPQPDEGMDIFLLTIAMIAVGIICGAAIVLAFTATFLLDCLFCFAAFGYLQADLAAC